jgi:hypothetical protein
MHRIKAKPFVELWLEAYEKNERIPWIASTMGISEQTVYKLKRACIRAGIELPDLNRTFGETIDVKAMNELIKKQLNQ